MKSFSVHPIDNTYKKDETFIFSLTERKFNEHNNNIDEDNQMIG